MTAKVTLTGNIAQPETRTLPNGGEVTNFTVFVYKGYKDKATGKWVTPEGGDDPYQCAVFFDDVRAEVDEKYAADPKGRFVVLGDQVLETYTDSKGVENRAPKIKVREFLTQAEFKARSDQGREQRKAA